MKDVRQDVKYLEQRKAFVSMLYQFVKEQKGYRLPVPNFSDYDIDRFIADLFGYEKQIDKLQLILICHTVWMFGLTVLVALLLTR